MSIGTEECFGRLRFLGCGRGKSRRGKGGMEVDVVYVVYVDLGIGESENRLSFMWSGAIISRSGGSVLRE